MARPMDGCLGSAFLLVNSYEGNQRGLDILPDIDKAAEQFWKTFHTLRFSTMICYNVTRTEFNERIESFIRLTQGLAAEDKAKREAKYVIFFFIGHGSAGDTLYMQDGSCVRIEKIDELLFKNLLKPFKILFIDACREDPTQHIMEKLIGYTAKHSNTYVAQSALPYQRAWRENQYTYGRLVLGCGAITLMLPDLPNQVAS